MNDEQIFWMVWSPEGRPPVVKHASERLAITEAKRLARINGDCTFYVLKATARYEAGEVLQVVLTQPPEPDPVDADDIPF